MHFPSVHVLVATDVFSAILYIIHVFVYDACGIRTCTDAATSPSFAMYVVSTYWATETSHKKEA